jgi:hypothetical protein
VINRVFPLLRPKPSANNAHNALAIIAQKTAITEACNHASAAGGRIFFSGKVPFSSSKAEDILHCSHIERLVLRSLASRFAACLPRLRFGLRFVLALEIQRHCCADQILQGCFIDFFAFVDVDGAPDISFEAGVE